MSKNQKRNNNKYSGIIILILTILICFAYLSFWISNYETADISFISVGQGDSCFIQTREGRNILIDSGTASKQNKHRSICYQYLQKLGVNHIDLAVISHYDSDHMDGLFGVSKNMRIRILVVPAPITEDENNKLVELKMNCPSMKIVFANTNDRIWFNRDIILKELLVGTNSKMSSNSRSLVIDAGVHSKKFLFTGDIDAKVESKLIAYLSKVDVLKVAHHGSRFSTSDEFLEKIRPDYAVICVGKNSYGHPSTEVLKRLKAKNSSIQILRTDNDGTIKFRINKRENSVEVRTFKAS